jgi:hypothetical protein
MSTGLPSGSRIIGPVTITGTSIVGETLDFALQSGDNTFAVPPGAVAVLFVPPINNVVGIKYRTSLNAADVGVPLSVSDAFGPHSFRGLAPTSIIINAAGIVAGCEIVFI